MALIIHDCDWMLCFCIANIQSTRDEIDETAAEFVFVEWEWRGVDRRAAVLFMLWVVFVSNLARPT